MTATATAPATFSVMYVVPDPGTYTSYNRTITLKIEGEDAAHGKAAELSIAHPGQIVSVFPKQGRHTSYLDGAVFV